MTRILLKFWHGAPMPVQLPTSSVSNFHRRGLPGEHTLMDYTQGMLSLTFSKPVDDEGLQASRDYLLAVAKSHYGRIDSPEFFTETTPVLTT